MKNDTNEMIRFRFNERSTRHATVLYFHFYIKKKVVITKAALINLVAGKADSKLEIK